MTPAAVEFYTLAGFALICAGLAGLARLEMRWFWGLISILFTYGAALTVFGGLS